MIRVFRGVVVGCALSLIAAQAHATFLQTDPLGYKDGLNWYAYVGNDPVNRTDPTGQFTYVVNRPVAGIGNHMFIVTNALYPGDPNGIRFSGGPAPNQRDAALVPLAGVPSPTNTDDARTWVDVANGTHKGEVIMLPTEIPDATVFKVGSSAIGNPDYDILPSDGANSNSYARAIVNRSATASGVDPTSIPNPSGWNPGADQANHVQFSSPPPPPPPPCIRPPEQGGCSAR